MNQMCLSISPLSLSQTALYKGGSCGGIGPHNRKVAAGWEGQGQAISSAYTRHSRGTLPSLTLPPLSWTAWGPGELLTFSGRSLRSPPRCGRAAATGGQQRSVRAFSREAASERLWSMRSACWPAKAVCPLQAPARLRPPRTCSKAPVQGQIFTTVVPGATSNVRLCLLPFTRVPGRLLPAGQ